MTRRIGRLVRNFCCLLLAVPGFGSSSAQSRPIPSIPIIFVHGNGDDAAKWIGIIWLFESNGYPSGKLFAVRFTHPNARTNNIVDEPNRSSTTDATAELSAFVTRVLIETQSTKVALVGSSRGGMTIRNYLLHGGSQNVAYAVTCGTPNHGVLAMDANPDAEFNGKGHYLESLNHAYADGSEVSPGVKMMTLRSDTQDKYAQPKGVAFGNAAMATGVNYDGPSLAGATNRVLPRLDHRELAFDPAAFAEMYQFITGEAPATKEVASVPSPVLSGLITGYEDGAFTNLPLAGVHLRIYPVGRAESTTPAYEVVTGGDGKWGPFPASSSQEYEFDMEYQGRRVRLYKAAMPRSTMLLNLRFLPVPKDASPGRSQLLVSRPEGYFSREHDPVFIDNRIAADEPAGLPLEDAFIARVSTPADQLTTVRLQKETISARPSVDLATDLAVVDFLW